MRRITTLEERQQIGSAAQAGCSDHELGRALGWSIATIRKWRRRVTQGGDLASRMGRPRLGAAGTFPSALRETLLAWRRAHPGWGAKTLHAQAQGEARFAGQALPSSRSIHRLLHTQGLVRGYERHSVLPTAALPAPLTCHERWQMDARGYEVVPGVGWVVLLNLSDCYSHTYLLSYPCVVGETRATRHPNTRDYQDALRLAFIAWGLPASIQVDHESVFYDNLDKSPFPTRLHLWLLALGTPLIFSRVGRPTDQAQIERAHQTWYRQALQEQRFADLPALYQALHERRDFLNASLPCASLGERPPLLAHPEALFPRRCYRPEMEVQLLRLERIYAFLAQGHWFRRASNIGAISLGQQRYPLGIAWAHQEVDISFDPEARVLVCRSAHVAKPQRVALRNLTPQMLMGELHTLVNATSYQLALPFTLEAQQVIRLSGTLVSQLIDT